MHMNRSVWQIIEGVKSKGNRSPQRWKWKMSMSKNNLGCCSGRPFATQVAENKTRVAAAEGEMLMLSMLLLSVIIVIIIYNRKLPKDTWWSVPQNCRSDEGQVSVEGRWQRKQPEDFFSIFLQSLVTIKQIRVEGRKLKAPSQSHLLLPLAKVLDTKHP